MTPTEQDNELLIAIQNVETQGSFVKNEITGRAMKEIAALITADRKRVALEARIDERQMLSFHRAYGRDYQATLETLEESNDERIAELKAQQEQLEKGSDV